jgi:amino acid adenylation domain-containing protein
MSSILVSQQTPTGARRRPPSHLAETKRARIALAQPNWRIQPRESSIPQLVSARATSSPTATALDAGAESITYGELDDRANQIAHYLIALGVGTDDQTNPNNIVALCLDRSVNGVVCALGTLKAGAAYLPLDPAYPAERLSFMLNDARPRVLITTRQVAAQLPAGPWKVIAIDRELAEIRRESTTNPDKQVMNESLAYVIYTSGSSGRPKGVEITHGSLMNLVSWHRIAFEVTERDRASLLAGVGFDAAVWETWPYLAAGASLHLPPDAVRLAPELLRDWLVAERITISFLPTALAERVMTLAWPRHTALRSLLTGAETLRQFPSDDLPFKVINNYGPTECTVVTTSGSVSNSVGAESLPTIGRPIANCEVYILDEYLERVPLDTAGEIYIGGKGVARGYLNRPDLTAEKFIKNPFSNDPDARLYRTGDLARYLPNGEIAYLGRVDEQIKILGHRIEPNEIVTMLDRHPDILASRVLASGETCGEKHLVAYVVLTPESQCSTVQLRSFLEQHLPQYMVPSVFVRIENLPLTPNGKVDLSALPAPDVENTLRDEEFTAPRTAVEERLSLMLCALLGLVLVSVNDNFFMLGGHSLLGTQLISQIRGAFGVEMALRTLFESPTIEYLAIEIERLVMERIEAMSEDEVQRLLS